MNLDGVSKLSKERLLDELKKILKINILINLSKDKTILDIMEIIFQNLNILILFLNLTQRQRIF